AFRVSPAARPPALPPRARPRWHGVRSCELAFLWFAWFLSPLQLVEFRRHLHRVEHVVHRVVLHPGERTDRLQFLGQRDRLGPGHATVSALDDPDAGQHEEMLAALAENRAE